MWWDWRFFCFGFSYLFSCVILKQSESYSGCTIWLVKAVEMRIKRQFCCVGLIWSFFLFFPISGVDPSNSNLLQKKHTTVLGNEAQKRGEHWELNMNINDYDYASYDCQTLYNLFFSSPFPSTRSIHTGRSIKRAIQDRELREQYYSL